MSTYGGPQLTEGGVPGWTQLVDLRRLVRAEMGVPTSDDFFTDTVLNDAINQAIGCIEEEHYWPWSMVTANQPAFTGVNVVTPPVDWRATRSLYYGASELQLVSVSDVLGAGTALGTPEVWADFGTELRVAPAPSGDITLIHTYYVTPALLVANTDAPRLPSSMTGALVSKAAELLSAREDDQTARAAHNADYQKWVQRMLRSQRRSTGPLKVRVRPGSWI
jgi:hypothetical protein